MTTFWTTGELRSLGKSPRDIRLAEEQRLIGPVRRGHWSTPGADPQVVRAVRVGGIATGTTASRALGLRTPPDATTPSDAGPDAAFRRRSRPLDRLHVAVPSTCGRLRDPDDAALPLKDRPDVVIHYVEAASLSGTARTRIAEPLLMLVHVFATQPPERALAVVDSALRTRRIRRRDLAALRRMLPVQLRSVLDAADPRADSGIETIVRFLLRTRGLRVESLVGLARIGEVDLLVEGRLIVECDGREFHDDDDAFARDRERDLEAARARYRVLRVTWYQVLFQWESVEAAVFAALAG